MVIAISLKLRGKGMLELLSTFKKIYSRHGDEPFIKLFKPFNGIYLSIDKDNNINRIMDLNTKSRKQLIETVDYEWFRERDYYSSWINSNKAVNSKKMIQSNNCYALYVKRKSLPDQNEKFYVNLKLHFESLETLVGDGDIEENNDQHTRWLKAVESILCFAKENNIGDNVNIKAFLDVDIERFNKMSRYYFKDTRIFLDKKKIVEMGGEIYGIPNFSAAYDAKKPYLKLKQISCPSIVSLDDAFILEKGKKILPYSKCYLSDLLLQMEVDDVLEELNRNQQDMYLDIKSDNGTPVLNNLEIISNQNDKVKFTTYELVEKEIIPIIVKLDTKELRNIFDELYCNNNLYKLCFYEDLNKVKHTCPKIKKMARTYKNELINYFYKGHSINVSHPLMKIMDTNIKESIYKYGINNFIKLKLKTKQSFCGLFNEVVEMTDYKKSLKEKVLLENQTIENDDELCFVIGQVIYYLAYQSKAKLKTGKLYRPFLSAKKITLLKKRLIKSYEKYCYNLNINPKTKLNKAVTMVTQYSQSEELINKEMLLLGLTSKNLLFEDKKTNKQ